MENIITSRTDIMDTVIESLNARHLNFTAKMAETYALIDGEYQPTGRFTPIRDDKTGADAIIAGSAFSTRFVPIQNRDAFKVIADMAQVADVEFVNVGSWGNGAGVYAQISLGDSMTIGNTGDKVGRYLSLVNSHDGSRSLSVLVTPFRFFCKNQIAKAVKEATQAGNIVGIRHDAYGEDRLREVAKAISVSEGVFKRSEEEYARLADTTVSMDQVREAMARMLPWNGIEQGPGRTTWENKIYKMVDRFNSADNGQTERMTGWNLYNAIQGTFQHDTRRTQMYEKSIILGDIAKKSADALQVVTNVIYAPTLVRTEHEQFDRVFRLAA